MAWMRTTRARPWTTTPAGGRRRCSGAPGSGGPGLSAAADWYVANDRIVADGGPGGPVAGWARDIATPKFRGGPDDDIAMFAWRRANVAELNRLGRAAWAEMGNLSGPELVTSGGAAFAAGDRIVTLAPELGASW